jgi:MFS family permease
MVVGGVIYAFASIAAALKDKMHYQQYEINFIGTMNNLGSITAIIPGIINDKFGPRLTTLVSSSLMFVGFFLMYVSAAHYIFSTYWLMGIYMCIFSTGASGVYYAGVACNIKNFDARHRGKIFGVMLSVYGLSSALFSAIYAYGFNYRLLEYMLFVSILSAVGPMVSGFIFLNDIPKQTIEEGVPEQKEEDQIEKTAEQKPVEEQHTDSNPFQMLMSLDFYLICVLTFCGVGSGLVITINLGSLVASYGGNPDITPNLIIIYSFASSIGRLIMGVSSDLLGNYANRGTFVNICMIGLGFTSLSFYFATVPLFYPLIFSTGFFYGGVNTMLASVLSERFGAKYYAINTGLQLVASTTASYLIATLLASAIYQSNIPGEGTLCYGRKCFEPTFLITTTLCVIGYLAGLVLMHRTRGLYALLRSQAKTV